MLKLKLRESGNKEIIDKFFRNISHDIRTPLNGIMGITELLRKSELSQKQQEYVNLITVSSNQLLTVITDLMEFNLLDKAHNPRHDTVFSMHDVIGEVSDLLSERLMQKKITLNTYIDTRIPFSLSGDVIRLRQILLTFLRDSIQNSEKGEILLRVEWMRTYDEVTEVRFRISDQSRGFNAQELKELLEENESDDSIHPLDFIDPDNRLKLKVARRILETLGGHAAIESQHGTGSALWFSLNFKKPDQKKHPETLRSGILEELKVYLVDPNPGSRAIFRQFLQYLNTGFAEFETGADCLASLTQNPGPDTLPHVVILSMDQDYTDNYAFIQVLRDNPQFSRIRRICIGSPYDMQSPHGNPEDNFHLMLSKPLKISDLYHGLLSMFKPPITKSSPFPGLETETGTWNILLAEDNLINEKVAVATLNRLGHKVDTASNGKIAVQRFMEKKYHLILMDIQMPEMDGIEATRTIRRLESEKPGREAVRIVALTAEAHPEDRVRCMEAGMDDYITKPFKYDELVKILTFEEHPNPDPS